MPTLTECLQTDHRRLDTILAECNALATAGRFAAAADHFVTFRQGLARHIDAEEGVLFPALAKHAPHAAGPMSVMRAEHGRIRELMANLAGALAASNPAWSMVRPRSRATSAVRSSGKPYVSYKRNTVSPGMTVEFNLAASASSSAIPVVRVSAKRASSWAST